MRSGILRKWAAFALAFSMMLSSLPPLALATDIPLEGADIAGHVDILELSDINANPAKATSGGDAESVTDETPSGDAESVTDETPSGDAQAVTDETPSGDAETVTDETPSDDAETVTDETPSGDAQAVTDETPSGDAETVTDETPSGDAQAVTDETPSGDAESVTDETPSGDAESVTDETPSGDAETVTDETPSGDAESVTDETPSSDAESVTDETPSGDAESVTDETPSGDAQAVTDETPSGDAESVTDETPSGDAESVTDETPSDDAETVTDETPSGDAETVTDETPSGDAESVTDENADDSQVASFVTLMGETPTEVGTWADLQTALNSDTETTVNLILTADVDDSENNGALEVYSGHTAILDLNGHTIDRKNNGYVFYVSGSLTVDDSSAEKTGTITGGNSYYGGGVFVDGNGAFTLLGGSITGNTADDYGGGVYVSSNGAFDMSGGSITGNTAQGNGGGVFVYSNGTFDMSGGSVEGNTANYNGGGAYVNGAFTMSGGSITNNTANSAYGGVYASTVSVSGAATVKDNKTVVGGEETVSNVTLFWDSSNNSLTPLTVTGQLTGSIGLTISSDQCPTGALLTSGFGANGNANLSGDVLFSDNETMFTPEMNADSTEVQVRRSDRHVSSWTALRSAMQTVGGKIILDADVADMSGEGYLYVPTGYAVTLDLNGHKIDRALQDSASYNGYVIRVNGELTIEDSSEGQSGKITGGNCYNDCGGVYVDSGAFTLSGGSITGNAANGDGGGVYVNSGAFTLSGGSITGNAANGDGGGVYVINNGAFTLSGGSITGNTVNNDGGGVYVNSGAFTLSGGSITGNTANEGGGVYVYSGSFDMSGGSIESNTATNGGGVFVSGGTFDMSGGSIESNTANYSGGGVYVDGTFTLSDGSIESNTANYGGGVYVNSGALTMSGGSIAGNTVNDGNGGGVCMDASGAVSVSGAATVKDNKKVADSAETVSNLYLAWDSANSNVVPLTLSGTLTGNVGLSIPDKCVDSVLTSGFTASGNALSPETGLLSDDAEAFTLELSDDGAEIRSNRPDRTASDWAALQQAMAKPGGTIILSSDVADNAEADTERLGALEVPAGMRVILDLNGHKIDRARLTSTPRSDGYVIHVAGELTILDSSEAKSGVITGGNVDGPGGGAYVESGAALTLDGGAIQENKASGAGGGVYADNGGALTLNGGVISGNESGANGGGAYVGDNGALTLNGGVIKENTASGNGGGACAGENVTLSVTGGAEITKNVASGSGGGLYADSNATLSVDGAKINGNATSSYGGGLYVSSGASFSVSNSEIQENTANYSGGGAYSSRAFSVTASVVSKNVSGSRGGGLYADSSLTVTDSELKENTASGDGGGAYGGASLTVTNSKVKDNQSSGNGGGVCAVALTVSADSELSGNAAQGNGGGAYATDVVSLTDSKVKDNTASGDGGGIYCASANQDATFSGAEVSGNTASRDGGGVYVSANGSGALRLTDSDITANKSGGNGGGVFLSAGSAQISGPVQITGNVRTASGGESGDAANNICLNGAPDTQRLFIAGSLTKAPAEEGDEEKNASIGLSVSTARVVTSGLSAYGAETHFSSDSDYYALMTDSNGEVTLKDNSLYAVFNGADTLTFRYDLERPDDENTYFASDFDSAAWSAHKAEITKVVFDEAFVNAGVKDVSGWFEGMSNLTEIQGLEYLNVRNVTNADRMFNGCSALTEIDFSVSGDDWDALVSAASMFRDCSALETVNLSSFPRNWAPANVESMFRGCSALTTICTKAGATWNAVADDDLFRDCAALVGMIPFDEQIGKVHATTNQGYFTVRVTAPEDFGELSSSGSVRNLSSAYYRLDADLTENNRLMFPLYQTSSVNAVIDLNGHTLQSSGNDRAIIVGGGALTLTDSSQEGSGKLEAYTDRNTGEKVGGARVDGGSFTLSAGAITGNAAQDDNGGGVCVNGGSFTMSGGAVTGNATQNGHGGGVYVTSYGLFTMSGGEISGNTASYGGGGAYIDSGAFTLSGGRITGNAAQYGDGGGVCVNSGAFTMSGGEISGNSVTNGDGGGVYLGSSMSLSGGAKITGNTRADTDNSANNLYLAGSVKIRVVDALAEDCVVGILAERNFRVITSGLNGFGGVEHFTADNSRSYQITLTEAGEAAASTPEAQILDARLYAVYNGSDTLTFCHDDGISQREGAVYAGNDFNSHQWTTLEGLANITKVVFEEGFEDARPTSLEEWFADMTSLSSIENLHLLNASQASSAAGMFRDCAALTEADLSGFDLSAGVPMDEMFKGCTSLKTIYVPMGADWSGNSGNNMFDGCEALSGMIPFDSENVGRKYAKADGGYFTVAIRADSVWEDAACTLPGGCYRMLDDVTVNSLSVSGGTVVLDLNGHTLRSRSFSRAVVNVTGGELTVRDSSEAGTGVISGSGGNVNGGGAYVSGGVMTLESGAISGCQANQGGGAYIDIGGAFNLSGGAITGNAASYGGGVYVAGGSFRFLSGSVVDNTASDDGGGVYVNNGGAFRFVGGSMAGNTAEGDGGGVYVNNGDLLLSGGAITGNAAQNNGGGVYLSVNARLDMISPAPTDENPEPAGIQITGNGVTNGDGGGVYVTGGAAVNLGGKMTVTGNTRSETPDNVYLTGGVLTLKSALDASSKIGVGLANYPGTITRDLPDYGALTNFVSDNDFYSVKPSETEGAEGEAVLINARQAYALFNSGDGVLTFYYDEERTARSNSGTIYYNESDADTLSGHNWREKSASVRKAVFDPLFANYAPTSLAGWFQDMSALTEIEGLTYLDVSKVTSMEQMFSGCSSLTELDMRSFTAGRMSNVQSLDSMFLNCSELQTIYTQADTNWATLPKVGNNYRSMFSGCAKLTGIQKYKSNRVNAVAANTANGYFTVKTETKDEFLNASGRIVSGLYQMVADIELDANFYTSTASASGENENIILDLNGHTLSGDGVIIRQQNQDAPMEIRDSAFDWAQWDGDEATLPETYGKMSGVSLQVASNCTLTLNGGAILNANRNDGGAVYVNEADTTSYRPGVFIMDGGLISENTALRNGGGVYNWGSFTLNGGVIAGNRATSGGGVYNQGSFTMNGGAIRANGYGAGEGSATQGGGVYNRGELTMNGGAMENNTATEGGGVYNASMNSGVLGVFVLNGGELKGNAANMEGGGGGYNDGSMTLNDGKISENTAPEGFGGGIYNNRTLTLSGGVVTGNASKYRGGGVFSKTRVSLSGKPMVYKNDCERDNPSDAENQGKNFVFQYDDAPDGIGFDIIDAMAPNGSNFYVSVFAHDSSNVGTYLPQKLFTFTTGFAERNPDLKPGKIFRADSLSGGELMVSSTVDGEGIITNHVHANLTYTPNAEEGSVTITCSEEQGACFLGNPPESEEEEPIRMRTWKLVPPESFLYTGNPIAFDIAGPYDADGALVTESVVNYTATLIYSKVTTGEDGVTTLEELSGPPSDYGAYQVSLKVRENGQLSAEEEAAILTVDKAFRVEKQRYDLSAVEWSDDEFPYDGQEHSVIIIGGLPEGVTIHQEPDEDGVNADVYTGNKATNADTYTARAVLDYDAENYEEPVVEHQWRITQGGVDPTKLTWVYDDLTDPSAPVPREYSGPLTYTGRPQTVYLKGDLPEGVILEYSNDKQTDAGTYTATATFEGDAERNYTQESLWEKYPGDLEWTIAPADISGAGIRMFAPCIYDGREQWPDFAVTLNGVTLREDVDYTCSGDLSAIDPRSEPYRITITGVGNCTGTKTLEWIINEAELVVTANPVTIRYGDAPAADGVTYDGFLYGDDESVLRGELSYEYSYQQFGNVGEYTVTPKGLLSDKYAIKYESGVLTVEPKEITLAWSATELPYTGRPQTPVAEADGLANGDECAVTVSGEQADVGASYVATAVELSNANYALPANASTNYSILPRSVENAVITLSETAFPYDGESKKPDVISVTLPEEGALPAMELTTQDYSVSYSDNQDIGTATVTVSGRGNYAGSVDAHFAIGVFYTVTFNSNGGSEVASAEALYNETVTRPADPTRDGYAFENWQLDGVDYNFAMPVTENVTLVAKWNPNACTVTFNVGEGTWTDSAPASATVAYGATVAKPSDPVRTGYVFSGWRLAGSGGAVDYSFDAPVTENLTLSAQWTALEDESFAVVFYTNGGNSIDSQIVSGGSLAPIPANPVRSGYTFVDWTFNGEKYSFDTPVTSNITLTAQWKAIDCAVTFLSNGGSETPSATVPYGTALTRPDDPARDGYAFTGWKLNGADYNFETLVTTDMTLTAQWSVLPTEQRIVTFDPNGGKWPGGVTSPRSTAVSKGQPVSKPDNAPTYEGYSFEGWRLDGASAYYNFNEPVTQNITLKASWRPIAPHIVTFELGGGKWPGGAVTPLRIAVSDGLSVSRPEQPVKDGYSFVDWRCGDIDAGYNFNEPVTQDITLTANWTPGVCSVTFNVNGGSAVETQTVNYGAKASRPPNPTRDGFTFENWYSDAACQTLYDFDVPVYGSLTLYAKWTNTSGTVVTHKVTFHSNGGSAVAEQTVNDGEKASRPDNPTRDDFTFENWYSDAVLQTPYDFNTAIYSDVTLYAKWTPDNPETQVTHKVRFYSNGNQVEEQNVSNGGLVTRPANPVLDGYAFDNWFADSQYQAVFDFNTPIQGDLALYAHWNQKTPQGCYVATAVYGSYDCPEVWTLRRFRDRTLARTWYGRLFIRLYYAVSPTCVKLFGDAECFQNFFRGVLNPFVARLQENGFESTPYQDLDW